MIRIIKIKVNLWNKNYFEKSYDIELTGEKKV
jgi:hypothetical protein